MTPARRPFYGPWIIAACFVTFGVASGLPFYNIAFFYDYLRDDHGWTQQMVTLGAPVAILLTIWAGPLLAPRLNPRYLIVVGTGLTCLSFQWFGRLGDSPAEYYGAWCLYMLGYLLSGPIPHQIIISNWYRRRRGQAMGIAYIGGALAGAVGNKLAPWLVTVMPYRSAIQVLGLTLLVAWPLAFFVLKDRPEDLGQHPDGDLEPSAPPEDQVPSKTLALASGNTVVMKPPDAAPLSATRFFELLLEAGFPPGHLNLVHGPGATLGPWLVANPDIAFFTFTGSTGEGQWLHAHVGLRPVALELGSIAATIVCEDADLDRAAARSAASGFRRAGQMCTSTQRLFVHDAVLEPFTEKLLTAVRALKVGDPRDPKTDVGPMISEAEAARAEVWVREAVSAGARLLAGGRRDGPVFHPTVLAGVDATQKVVCEEIFAPVLSLIPFSDLDAAIDAANATRFGLAVGLFTNDLSRALRATRRLHFGVVHLNESSSSRVDLIPFSGVKQSGLGREGARDGLREFQETRYFSVDL